MHDTQCFRRGDYASCSKVKCMKKAKSRRTPTRVLGPKNVMAGNLHHLLAIRQQHQLHIAAEKGADVTNNDANGSSYRYQQPIQNVLEQYKANLLLKQLSAAAPLNRNRATASLASASSISKSIAIESELLKREIERIDHENNLLSQLTTNLHIQQAQTHAQQKLNMASMNQLSQQHALAPLYVYTSGMRDSCSTNKSAMVRVRERAHTNLPGCATPTSAPVNVNMNIHASLNSDMNTTSKLPQHKHLVGKRKRCVTAYTDTDQIGMNRRRRLS